MLKKYNSPSISGLDLKITYTYSDPDQSSQTTNGICLSAITGIFHKNYKKYHLTPNSDVLKEKMGEYLLNNTEVNQYVDIIKQSVFSEIVKDYNPFFTFEFNVYPERDSWLALLYNFSLGRYLWEYPARVRRIIELSQLELTPDESIFLAHYINNDGNDIISYPTMIGHSIIHEMIPKFNIDNKISISIWKRKELFKQEEFFQPMNTGKQCWMSASVEMIKTPIQAKIEPLSKAFKEVVKQLKYL